jgi:thioredoxin-dependent peroxiredoxin
LASSGGNSNQPELPCPTSHLSNAQSTAVPAPFLSPPTIASGMTELSIGMPAPDFCLQDKDEQTVCLADLRGTYAVIYFYPKDNTSGCTLEAKSFSDEMEAFASLNTPVIGISPDSTKSHRKFAEKQNLSVRLLSDPDHVVIEAYGAWVQKKLYGREYMGVERSTFIIDPEGKVAAVWRKVKVKGHVAEVKAKVEEITAAGSAH